MSKKGLLRIKHAVADIQREAWRASELSKNHLWLAFVLPGGEESIGQALPLSHEDFASLIADLVEDLSERLGLSEDLVWRAIDVERSGLALGGGHA